MKELGFLAKQEKLFIIFRGVAGSGKSSFAKLLLDFGVLEQIHAADDWFDENTNGVFDPNQLGRAHGQCKYRVHQAMKEGKRVGVHNTFTRERDLKPYLVLAQKEGYTVVSVLVENRHGSSSVHGVPEVTLQKMASQLLGSGDGSGTRKASIKVLP